MSIIKETVATVKELERLSNKLDSFNEFDDLNELIEIMNYENKIRKILNWINNTAAKPIPVAVMAEPETVINQVIEKVAPVIPTPEPIVETVSVLPAEPAPMSEEMKALAEQIADAMLVEQKVEEEVVKLPESNECPVTIDSYPEYNKDVNRRVVENYKEESWAVYKRDIEWRRSLKNPIMISVNGDFWSLADNKVLRPIWVDGDVRINVAPNGYPEELKRAANLIGNCYNIPRPENFRNSSDYVIDFKDHDRRHLAVDNLTWIKNGDQLSSRARLIHDICQRCLDDNFDTSKVIAHYIDIRPTRLSREINREYVHKIINKTDCAEISDMYWSLDIMTGDPVRLESKKNGSVDIYVVFDNTHDIALCESLFCTKITNNFNLSAQEKELLVNIAKNKIPANNRKFSVIAQHIKNIYGWTMTADEVKGFIQNPTDITKKFNQMDFIKEVNRI